MRSGNSIGIGSDGFSWSSTASGNTGVYSHFSTQYLNPGRANFRAYGLQLRCLSE
ncbi:hypothetical protein [uncultured Rikenella sp.]|uniref:hypothetical protein n=1 Tax=uncultured Rikenella sp. TaxID=368003 RepID=UPI002634BB60|nr:hypothetical protein [uncultured Rikenella sp.]